MFQFKIKWECPEPKATVMSYENSPHKGKCNKSKPHTKLQTQNQSECKSTHKNQKHLGPKLIQA